MLKLRKKSYPIQKSTGKTLRFDKDILVVFDDGLEIRQPLSEVVERGLICKLTKPFRIYTADGDRIHLQSESLDYTPTHGMYPRD